MMPPVVVGLDFDLAAGWAPLYTQVAECGQSFCVATCFQRSGPSAGPTKQSDPIAAVNVAADHGYISRR